jgi:hypothetical protein
VSLSEGTTGDINKENENEKYWNNPSIYK